MIRQYDSFDPDIPDGLQVEVYDDEPAEPDPVLHDMIAAGNKLIAAYNEAVTVGFGRVAANRDQP